MSFLDRIKEANRTPVPEESVTFRAVVLVAVVAAVSGLVVEGIASGAVAVASLVVIPIGFVVSHVLRRHELLGFKAVLAIGLVIVLADFFRSLGPVAGGDLSRVQVPLAEVFLWVQILHSMHVPARKDLVFSLVASGVTFAVSAVISVSTGLAPFLGVWLVATVVALGMAYRNGLEERANVTVPSRRGRPGAPTVGVIAAVVLLTLFGYALLPAAGTSRALAFPVDIPRTEGVGAPGTLSNPTLGDADPKLGDTSEGAMATRNSFGYFGFADSLDTGVRGRPDDTLVMRVRAPAPDFWKGQTFDVWDGRTWRLSTDESRQIAGEAPMLIPPTWGDIDFNTDEFIHTFYLETSGPNIAFGANRIAELYFPDRRINQLSDGTLRANVELGSGTVYTVVSARSLVNASMLRQADPLVFGMPEPIALRYLQLPDVPQRVTDLAHEITRDVPTTYDKIRAIEQWMAVNTTYTLDIPPLPIGADATEHYLFQTRQGFCEQIGTSLVVMLRSLGIPARLAVGYTPGERNPFTGLFEVRASDAHSWAEVWFPGVGWQSFDPTAQVPLAGEFEGFRAGSGLNEWLQRRAPWLGTVWAVGLRFAAVLVVIGTAVFGGLHAIRGHQRRRAMHWYDTAAARIGVLGAKAGRPRRSHETLLEYATALDQGPLADGDLVALARDLSAQRFGGRPEDASLDGRIAALERRHRVANRLARSRYRLGV